MKKLVLILSIQIAHSVMSSAQFVVIPDPQFVNYLNATIPAAMVGNQMDVSHPDVLSLTRIEVENDSIYDLTGVQYFTSLITLDCGNGLYAHAPNRLTFLPPLPSTLDTLICGSNILDSLPALPPQLRLLKCYDNPLRRLPPLPASLTYLDCSSDLLTQLPAPLPGGLYYLNCGHNSLGSLPALSGSLLTLLCNSDSLVALPVLPNSVTMLDCGNNLLTNLPALPFSLGWLRCSSNQLTALPTLPASLGYLDCYNNALSALPTLPGSLYELGCGNNLLPALPVLPGALSWLWCNNNQITSLPGLPGVLGFLDCSNNQLSGLPTLPSSLRQLSCANNQITCFPVFPMSVQWLTIYNNPFNCLPNYIQHMDSITLTYPLCSPANPNGCAPAQGLVGFTYADNNGNCLRDPGDGKLRNVPVTLYDNANTFLGKIFTALNGVYDFPEPAGTYTVVIDTAGMPFIPTCANPGVDSVVITTLLDTNINFAIACKPGFDIGIQSVTTGCGLIFPGQQHVLYTEAGDMSRWYNLNCAAGTGGQVQITVTGNVNYAGPASGSLTPSVSGNVYTYTIPDFGLVNNSTDFNLVFQTMTSAQAGDIICASVSVTPTAGDYLISNNSVSHCYVVTNSHDPNAKEVYPQNVQAGYQDWFTYTIHFQNTGNAPALNIRLEDTLDVNLDLQTLEVLAYSHNNTAVLNSNLLVFNFPNINLPDSGTNSAGSNGFVQYRIKPIANVTIGTKIKNTAYIYFDYNEAVVTNTAISTYLDGTPTGVNEIGTNDLLIYPNPTSDFLNIVNESIGSNASFEIIDMFGKKASPKKDLEQRVDVSMLPEGVYLLIVYNEGLKHVKTFVKTNR